MPKPDPDKFAADDTDVQPGIEAPTEDEQLEYLAAHGWPQ